MSDNVSIVCLLNGNIDFIPLIKDNFKNFTNKDNLELLIVDDGNESLMEYFCDIDNCTYLHLTKEEIQDFNKKILENESLQNKNEISFLKKKNILSKGFKRDYACGLSSNDYIFHMNYDCVYHPKSIERKLKFLKKVGGECIYCDTVVCYDIYQKGLYKSISENKIYESTLFHSREFWKRKGFQWSDVSGEGRYFHYNNGVDRKMDNYYDTIQLLSLDNLNQYKPIKITLENMDIKVPELVHEINITKHPFIKIIDQVYQNDNINVLGLSSDFLKNIADKRLNKYHIDNFKQKKLAKDIKNLNVNLNILFFNSKDPAWDLFEHIPFDIIILETHKNYEQMMSIISKCKKYSYLLIDGLFVRKDYLE